jgi:hypothetical protein
MYFATRQHVVRYDDGFVVVSRVEQPPLRSTYADIRNWGAGMWKQYPEVAAALVQGGHGRLVVDQAAETLLEDLENPFEDAFSERGAATDGRQTTLRPTVSEDRTPPPIAMPGTSRTARPERETDAVRTGDLRPTLTSRRSRGSSTPLGSSREQAADPAAPATDSAADQLDDALNNARDQVDSALESLFAPYEEELPEGQQAAPADIGPGWKRPARSAAEEIGAARATAAGVRHDRLAQFDAALPIDVGSITRPLVDSANTATPSTRGPTSDRAPAAPGFVDWDALAEESYDALRPAAPAFEISPGASRNAAAESDSAPAAQPPTVRPVSNSDGRSADDGAVRTTAGDVYVDLQSLEIELGPPVQAVPTPVGGAPRAAILPNDRVRDRRVEGDAGRVIQTQPF